eukprot:Phypoly_transcript_20020.p1 GENE.Phypoly_transcript_20020~~Phypoly_transcript_20020.p1  ORF type:complete len:114 (+),score=8.46 Phypoly_transcript_20020:25-342(+)
MTSSQHKKDEFAYDLDAFRSERPKTLGAMIKKDPHIFAGVGATLACLFGGMYTMYVGNREASQIMMRGRVFFQGVTVACLVYSGYNIINKYKLALDNEKKRDASL